MLGRLNVRHPQRSNFKQEIAIVTEGFLRRKIWSPSGMKNCTERGKGTKMQNQWIVTPTCCHWVCIIKIIHSHVAFPVEISHWSQESTHGIFLGHIYLNNTLNECWDYIGFPRNTGIHCFILKSNKNAMY